MKLESGGNKMDLQEKFIKLQEENKLLKAETENLKKNNEELKIKNNDLIEVNGKLFTRLSFDEPQTTVIKEEEETPTRVDLNDINSLKEKGVIK